MKLNILMTHHPYLLLSFFQWMESLTNRHCELKRWCLTYEYNEQYKDPLHGWEGSSTHLLDLPGANSSLKYSYVQLLCSHSKWITFHVGTKCWLISSNLWSHETSLIIFFVSLAIQPAFSTTLTTTRQSYLYPCFEIYVINRWSFRIWLFS